MHAVSHWHRYVQQNRKNEEFMPFITITFHNRKSKERRKCDKRSVQFHFGLPMNSLKTQTRKPSNIRKENRKKELLQFLTLASVNKPIQYQFFRHQNTKYESIIILIIRKNQLSISGCQAKGDNQSNKSTDFVR